MKMLRMNIEASTLNIPTLTSRKDIKRIFFCVINGHKSSKLVELYISAICSFHLLRPTVCQLFLIKAVYC